jgi:hypothetical protein
MAARPARTGDAKAWLAPNRARMAADRAGSPQLTKALSANAIYERTALQRAPLAIGKLMQAKLRDFEMHLRVAPLRAEDRKGDAKKRPGWMLSARSFYPPRNW